jgi:hypothetical protein
VFSVKKQRVNTCGYVSPRASAVITQLCHGVVKADIDSSNEWHCHAPIETLYIKSGGWPVGHRADSCKTINICTRDERYQLETSQSPLPKNYK